MVDTISFRYIYKMADPIEELNAVLMTCGINDAAMRASVIAHEGFTQIEDLGVLETDTDVTEMAKKDGIMDSGQR
jgi:hypothetical protein